MKLQKQFLALAFSAMLCFRYVSVLAQANPWQPTNGPEGGNVNVIAVNKSNGYIFAVVAGAGMMRSTDEGETWVLKNAGLDNTSVQTIAINANGDLFAGTNGQGVFRSTDHGESWVQVNSGIATTHRNIRALIVNSSTGDIFAGTSSLGLYRSSNNGNSWTLLPTGLTGAVAIQAFAIDHTNGNIFAGTDTRGARRSTDNGNSWTAIDTSSIYKNIRALIVTASGALLAGADSASTKRAILRLENTATTWELVEAPSSSINWFVLNSSNQIWAGTGGSGVYVSSDNGDNWTPRNDGLRGYGIRVLAVNASDHLFAGAHCSGIFRSTDGENWEAMNKGIAHTEILSLAVSPTTGMIVAGTHCGGVFRSSDNGNNWTWAGLPGASVQALTTLSNGYFLAGTARFFPFETQGDIYRSTDGGVTWAPVTPDNDAYFSFAVGPNDEVYAGTGFYQVCGIFPPSICDYGDIYRSLNNGSTWTRIASMLDDFVYALAVTPDGRVYAGTPEGIFRSRNQFWDELTDLNTRSLIVDPTDPCVIIAGTSGGIWRSPDCGDNWGLMKAMPNNFTWSFAAFPTGEIFAGTQTTGVLKSTDTGINWTSFNTGLANMNVRSLAIPHPSRQIFAGTNGSGVFRSDDAAPALSINEASVTEGNTGSTNAVFTVSLSAASGETVTVDFATADGSASAGSDYEAASGTVTFSAGTTTQNVTVAVYGDVIDEADETFFMNLSNSTNATLADNQGQATIIDDDGGAILDWLAPLTVSDGSVIFSLGFGGDPNATNGSDAGLDEIAAPPGFNYYAYFSIAPPASFLRRDIRGWTAPFESDIDWSLRIVNADGITSEVCWQPADLPSAGSFTLNGPGVSVDMRNQSCAQISGNAALTIEYRSSDCVQFDFAVAGGAWYLVSLPVTPDDASLAALFPGAVTAFGWDYATQNYLPAAQLQPGKAYWVLMLQAGNVEVCGQPVNSYSRNYNSQGWDLTGSVFASAPLLDDPENSVASLFGWNPASGQYVTIDPYEVEPKQGYWVLVFGIPSSITVGNDAASASPAKFSSGTPPPAFYQKYGALPPPPPNHLAAEQPQTMPDNFALHPNSPNPFNPSTMIAYDLPQPVEVKLEIFDMLGRRVRTLVNQMQQAGRYAITWDGRNEHGQQVASGTFIYRLQAGSFAQVRRMALVR